MKENPQKQQNEKPTKNEKFIHNMKKPTKNQKFITGKTENHDIKKKPKTRETKTPRTM